MKQWILFAIFIVVVFVLSAMGLFALYVAAYVAPNVIAAQDTYDFDHEGPSMSFAWKATDVRTGEEVDFRNYRDEVIVLNFWATWCGPCHRQMPNISRLHQAMEAEGLKVLSVTRDEDLEEVRAHVRGGRYEMPVAALKTPLPREYQVRAVPTTLILNREGTVVFRKVGTFEEWDSEMMQRQIRRLLESPVPQ